MLRFLASNVVNGPQILTSLHPAELTVLLEQAWNFRIHQVADQTGHPNHRSNSPGVHIPQLPELVLNLPPLPRGNPSPGSVFSFVLQSMANPGVRWDHLIYAYMIENTKIYEIFRRVVHELLHGEKLGVPREDTQLWLRATEELFYRDSPPFSITTLNSHIRPDLRATRRNAYHRMFGMDLNHGGDDNQPYSYNRADAANNGFVATFEELLREVWIGSVNLTNFSGARQTDDAKIADLSEKLHEMLTTRRLYGNLSREEFFFVAMMSWFHLTLEDNSLPIIRDLRADGASPEQRLFKIAQMVGLPAHGLSRSYFEIAEPLSTVLIMIETGLLNNPAAVPAYYTTPNLLATAMNTIITHWSVITGHDIKAGKVSVK